MRTEQYSARRIAYEALLRCFRDKAWSSKALDLLLKDNNISVKDSALATRITLGVLQNKAYLDYCIARKAQNPLQEIQPAVLVILELSAYQILLMDKIPARAAVNEGVELCKETGHKRAAGFVNALLRKLSKEECRLNAEGFGDYIEYLSVRYSHPQWLVRRLVAEKGEKFTEAFLAANNQAGGMYIQVNTLKLSVEEYCMLLQNAGLPYSETSCNGCLKLEGGLVTRLPGFDEGYFYVQDYAARLAAEIAGAEPGMKVLDVCAAPGGKSFSTAVRMKGSGSIISCDIHVKKLRLIQEGAVRLGISYISTCEADGRNFRPEFAESFDLVIADVPCSGIGVIQAKPEIRYKTEAEITAFPQIQAAILENTARYVKPGGTLLYSTCTVLQEENETLVQAFLSKHCEYAAVPFSCCGTAAPEGYYTFWPNVDGTAGFFAAKLKRK